MTTTKTPTALVKTTRQHEHCPSCDEQGKYTGQQRLSDHHTLIAWECLCGNKWNHIFNNDKIPDPSTLV